MRVYGSLINREGTTRGRVRRKAVVALREPHIRDAKRAAHRVPEPVREVTRHPTAAGLQKLVQPLELDRRVLGAARPEHLPGNGRLVDHLLAWGGGGRHAEQYLQPRSVGEGVEKRGFRRRGQRLEAFRHPRVARRTGAGRRLLTVDRGAKDKREQDCPRSLRSPSWTTGSQSHAAALLCSRLRPRCPYTDGAGPRKRPAPSHRSKSTARRSGPRRAVTRPSPLDLHADAGEPGAHDLGDALPLRPVRAVPSERRVGVEDVEEVDERKNRRPPDFEPA